MKTDPFASVTGAAAPVRRAEPSDPFTTLPSMVVPGPQMVTAGRYRLPNRDGSAHKGGWTRATNLASAISDTKALGDWECRMVLLGVREALVRGPIAWQFDGLFPEELRDLIKLPIDDLEPKELRRVLMDMVGTFKALAKAELGATRGNLAHQMVEHHHAGLPAASGTPQETLDKLPSYVSKLPLHKLEALPGMQERQVMVESLDACGTLDNILRDMLAVRDALPFPDHIADLKTQKRFWSWLEIACQLALYAHGDAMWNPIAARWEDMPPVNQERALVAWMPWEHPTGNPEVDIYEVDILKGWDALQTAHQVYGLRSKAKAKADAWGWLRPVPRQGLLEAYGARLRDAATATDASAIYAEAVEAGVWGEELEQVAQEILPRFA
jgi:hypothetical protein